MIHLITQKIYAQMSLNTENKQKNTETHAALAKVENQTPAVIPIRVQPAMRVPTEEGFRDAGSMAPGLVVF